MQIIQILRILKFRSNGIYIDVKKIFHIKLIKLIEKKNTWASEKCREKKQENFSCIGFLYFKFKGV